MMEIERKFIMKGFPEDVGLQLLDEVDIEQGYLSIEPEIRLHGAVDVNTKQENYRITLKSDGTLSRKELVTDVSKEFYLEAKSMLTGDMIQKRYRKYQYGVWQLEVCHVDSGTENEFYYGEIEFASEEEANAFLTPEWLGIEVTEDETYKMKNYWKRTRQ